jgi:hypothetical protein
MVALPAQHDFLHTLAGSGIELFDRSKRQIALTASFKPVWVSTSMKISSANSGRCSVSHALSAIASRVSLLEWLKKIRDTYVYPPFVEAPESRSTHCRRFSAANERIILSGAWGSQITRLRRY